MPKCGTTEEFFSGEWVIIDGNDGNVEGSLTIDNTMDGGGPAVVCNASALTANISGPDEVQPIQFCSWSASVSGGLQPYTYSWSGVLSGSASDIMSLVSESGWLNLTVTDDANSQVNTSKFITVDFQAPECF